MRTISALVLGLWLTACSVEWVKLTLEGEKVVILDANEVSNCTPNGTTFVSVISKVIVNRQPAEVQEELRNLARNRAADRGDAIVASGPVANGEQTYNIYRCRR